MAKKFKDFNQFVRPVEVIEFKYGPDVYTISGKIPFPPVLEAMLAEDEEDGTDVKKILDLLEMIMGDEYERLMQNLDLRHAQTVLMGIVEMIMEDFGEQEVAEGVEDLDGGKAQELRSRLKSRRGTSPSTGTKSKQTSAAITLSGVTRSAS